MPTNPRKAPQTSKTQNPPSQQAPTSASAWKQAKREKEGSVVFLPSGNSVRIKKGDPMLLLAMLRQGKVPNPLMPMVHAMIMGQQPEQLQVSQFNPEEALQTMEFMDELAISIVIEPKVEKRPAGAGDDWEPSEDAITVEDIDFLDRQFLFSVALGGPTELERFRQIQAQSVAPTQDGQGLQPPAQPPATPGDRPLPSVVSG